MALLHGHSFAWKVVWNGTSLGRRKCTGSQLMIHHKVQPNTVCQRRQKSSLECCWDSVIGKVRRGPLLELLWLPTLNNMYWLSQKSQRRSGSQLMLHQHCGSYNGCRWRPAVDQLSAGTEHPGDYAVVEHCSENRKNLFVQDGVSWGELSYFQTTCHWNLFQGPEDKALSSRPTAPIMSEPAFSKTISQPKKPVTECKVSATLDTAILKPPLKFLSIALHYMLMFWHHMKMYNERGHLAILGLPKMALRMPK